MGFSVGGGYVLPGERTHWEFVWNLKRSLGDSGEDVAVLFLDYGWYPITSVMWP